LITNIGLHSNQDWIPMTQIKSLMNKLNRSIRKEVVMMMRNS